MTFRLIAKRPHLRSPKRLRRPVVTTVAFVSGVAMAGLAGLAAAQAPTTLKTAKSSTLAETIAVDSRGLTVYELRPETTRHLLCTKANGCFGFWSPLKVASATIKVTAVRGVKGKLGILHRDGFFQVTLGGHPLYRFAGDASTKGMVSGQGIRSFHGTWHVVVAAASPTPTNTTPTTTTPTTTTPTTTTPTTPTYTYPTTTPTTTTPYYPGY